MKEETVKTRKKSKVLVGMTEQKIKHRLTNEVCRVQIQIKREIGSSILEKLANAKKSTSITNEAERSRPGY